MSIDPNLAGRIVTTSRAPVVLPLPFGGEGWGEGDFVPPHRPSSSKSCLLLIFLSPSFCQTICSTAPCQFDSDPRLQVMTA